MFEIHAIHAGNRFLYEDALEQHFRIRHDIFVRQRKWLNLEKPDGLEIDQFDTDQAVYLLGIEPGQSVVAGCRLVPTREPHLLSEVFPELANVRGIPSAADIFEWTRTFILPSKREESRLCKAPGMVYAGVVEFCLSQDIRQISMACEAYWIPCLAAMGWNPKPLGLPIACEGATLVGLSCDMTQTALSQTRSVYEIDRSVMASVAHPFERQPETGHVTYIS